MKFYRNILSLFFFALFLLSCEKDIKPSLDLSSTKADVANTRDTVEIAVTCNTNWTATISDIWCTITPKSGDGNGVIKVITANNPSTKARSATLQIYCQGLRKSALINQSSSVLTVAESSFLFEKGVNSKILNITANTKWELVIPSTITWLTASSASGSGNASIILTAKENSSGPERSAELLLKYSSEQKIIKVVQKRALNTPPTLPVISYPADNATNVNTIPCFKWAASTDPDNDAISYTVYYSKDNINWSEISTTDTQVFLKSHLNENTTYRWKLRAKDSYDDYVTSEIYTFTTGSKSGYADGEYRIHQNSTIGKNGAAPEILFIGDGFTAGDFQENALFEQNVKEGIDAFFNVEPYKSYRNYFRVYKMAAYSAESGASQADKSIIKNTALGSSFNGGSSVSINTDAVFNYAKKIPGVDEARLRKMLIVVLVNQDRYAGTTLMWSDGTAIAICPVSRSAEDGYKFKNVISHEAGGHGFGKLADEYINFQNKEIPAENKTEAQQFISEGFFANIDFTGVANLVKWNHLISLQGYDRVGVYQGAYYYSLGVWRSETSSCMVYNELYYNAPSREAIVKRILTYAGYSYSFSDFVDNDIQKAPSTAAQAFTKGVNRLTFVPLAHPVLIKR